MFLTLTLILLTGCSQNDSSSSSPSKVHNEKEEEFTVYGVSLGDSKDTLVKKIGVPDSKDADIIFNTKVIVYNYPNIGFFLYNDVVVQIISSDAEFTTLSGVGINSTLKEVKNIYNNSNITTGSANLLVTINNSRSIIFNFTANEVSSVITKRGKPKLYF